jgi:shikimate dehydrogenase
MPRLAVLGQPISHSRSPAMQTAALEELGLAPEWTYEAIEVSPNDFEGRVRAMAGEGFAGANVTIPHKLAALALADEATEAAREIGAANTLTFADGRIAADNTDATGILDAMSPFLPGKEERSHEAGGRPEHGREVAHFLSGGEEKRQEAKEWLADRRALVLGAGGSARAAVWALRGAGAEVSIWNRTAAKAEALAQAFGALSLSLTDSENLPVGDFNIVLNATSVGLAGKEPDDADLGADPDRRQPDLKALHLDADALSEGHVVVDLVYGAAETQLAAAARSRGASVVDGLEVLVRQGAASLRLWTGLEPPVEIMRRAARDIQWTTKPAPNT